MTPFQSVAVVGLGVNNRPLVPYWLGRGASVVVADRRSSEALSDDLRPWLDGSHLTIYGGGDYLDQLVRDPTIQVAYLTPGMVKDLPQIRALAERGIALSSETDLFLAESPAPVLGITGSAGKTTTTTLIGHALAASGVDVVVGGNIGRSLLPELGGLKPSMWAVMELSSFQLDLVERSPHGAVWLNLAPNHLDIHGSMEAYTKAKRHIIEFQSRDDWAVLPWDDGAVLTPAENFGGQRYYVSLDQPVPVGAFLAEGSLWWRPERGMAAQAVVSASRVLLPGRHNLFNVLAATAAVMLAGGHREAMAEVVQTFRGVAHRLETVRRVDDVVYINDSIATAPDRTFAALAALKGPIVLIAGGYDKHLDYREFGQRVVSAPVRSVILLGQTADKIAMALTEAGADLPIRRAESLEAAVDQARAEAEAGDTVLLSPASASYDMFSNFEERGQRFREIVDNL